ncbi:MAG: SUMF1/EgtB/PvdO family nonheme iron enzyme [Polyangiaceae bacterium]|nr:SUMF1/EgtB/PvdO family nonheme iron enzyme [Polyangiaceae bacterium]
MRPHMFVGVVLFACSATPSPSEREQEIGSGAASTPSAVAAVASASSPAASASATPKAGACPVGMLLVDGSYCPDLEVTCLEKFYSPGNHLWVCKKVKEPTKCLSDKDVPMRYCIDQYEFPNRKGERPMVMQNFYQAQVHCAKAGKRVCTEHEWTLACEGPERKPFPYGYVRDPERCNGDRPWGHPDKDKVLNRDPAELERLWQGKVSGSQPNCVTDYGVYDMPGNADELAASVTTFVGDPKQNFDNVTTGGPWYYGVRNMCRPKIYTHDESFAYYYLSWRCCAEADGKPTDPRAPKQIGRSWTFERVRDIAEHSWKLPLNPKWPGDEGYISGGPR